MLFSIILASNRPENLAAMFDNLEETAASPHSFEVLIKVDEEDEEMVAYVEDEQSKRPFAVRYMASPKDGGYYNLHHAYQTLFQDYSNPETYFVSVFTDEIRFETRHWDVRLADYVGLYPDDIFRLRISDFKNKNYYRMYECLPEPENYAITTRKWYELTGGMCSLMPGMKDVFWGVDSWHQCIEYYLGQCLSPTLNKGIYRGWPIHDVKVYGVEAGVGWEGASAFDRARRVGIAWTAINTRRYHENFYRLAQRLAAHIWAYHNDYPDYELLEVRSLRTHYVYDESATKNPTPLTAFSFRLPRFAYRRERMPGLLNLHKPTLTNRIRNQLSRLPVRTLNVLERTLRRYLILWARAWIFRHRRRLPHKIVENPEFKQVLVIDPRNGRPLRGWSHSLR